MISKLLKKAGFYKLVKKPGFIDRIKTESSQFKTVFDVGAYHGKFIDEMLLCNPRLTVHSFEPYNISFQFLVNKFKKQQNVLVYNYAVSDKAGQANFNINAFAETNSLLESASVNETINSLTKKESDQTVQVISLGDYCLQNSIVEIDLIKIDTQGNSFNVLTGLAALLKEKKIKYLYVEAEFIEIYKNEKLFSEIESLMRSFDYGIVDLYNLNYLNNDRLAWCDVLFTPNK